MGRSPFNKVTLKNVKENLERTESESKSRNTGECESCARKAKRPEEILRPVTKGIRLVTVAVRGGLAAVVLRIDRSQGVGSTGRAGGLVANEASSAEQIRGARSIAVGLLLLQRPGSLGAVHLLEVSHASVALAGSAGLHEIGNRDSCKQANDRNDDHDFNQREAGFA